jgi:hypothetical protein
VARNLHLGDEVFVPTSLLQGAGDQQSAFYRTTVQEIFGRRARVNVGANSEWVASSKCQRNIGLLVINFGDLQSETTLLDPLSKSVTQFCRLLASDDYVRFAKIRSLRELSLIWRRDHGAFSHVIVIGHGNGTGMKLAVDDWCTASQICDVLDVEGVSPKFFINLACQAGYAAFGKEFSEMYACAAFLGAYHSVHGAIASQFVQSFLVFHLLQGETPKVAFRHARDRVPGSTSFRFWRNGVLTTDA